MPKRIEFEGKVHEFPDDFSDTDISAALGGDTRPDVNDADYAAFQKEGFAGSKDELRTQMAHDSKPHEQSSVMRTMESIKNAPGTIAEGAKQYAKGLSLNPLENAKATGEMALSAATGLAANVPALFSDTPKETREKYTYEPRTEAAKGGMKMLGGLTAPIGEVNKGVSKGVSNITGINPDRLESGLNILETAAPMLKGVKAVKGPTPEAPPVKGTIPDSPVASLRAAGYRARPSDVAKAEPETATRGTQTAERYAGSDEMRKSLMTSNQKTTTKLGAEELGLPVNTPRLTSTIYNDARQPSLAKYREVGRAVGKFNPTEDLGAELDTIAKRDGLTPIARKRIARDVEQYKLESMTGPDAIKTVSALRRRASKEIQSDDPTVEDYGVAHRAVADAFEAELERQLNGTGQGELATQFRDARTSLAKIHDAESATVAGQIDAHIMNKMRKKGVPLSGRFAIIADAAEYAPHITKHPNSVNNVSGGGALPGAGPVLDMASGFTRPIARKVLESDLYQNRLGKPASKLGPGEGLSDYFHGPKKPPGGAPPSGGGEPIPKTPASSMLEAQKRAGDLSLADEILNPEQLPAAPSKLQAETSPQSRGDINFKASTPSGVNLAGDLGLAPEVASEGLPFNPTRHAVSDLQLAEDARVNAGPPGRVGGNRLSDEFINMDESAGPSKPEPYQPFRGGVDFKDPGALGQYFAPDQMREAGQYRTSDYTLAKDEGIPFEPPSNGGSNTPKPPMKGPKVDVSSDESGQVTAKTPGGEYTAQENGQYLQVKRGDTAKDVRGKGHGTAMLLSLADEAAKRGLTLASDISVSPAAARVYSALEKRGYTVKQNPSTVNKNTGNFVSKDPRVPVFEVSARQQAVGE